MMKKLAIALSAFAALMMGLRANAETVEYNMTGWQITCAASYYTGTQANCLYLGKNQGFLSRGTITGSGVFIGDSTTGGILTITQSTYVTSSTPGVGPATIVVTDGWWAINAAGQTTDGGGGPGPDTGYLAGGVQVCTPTSDTICKTPNTPLGTANIAIYPGSATIGGTVNYLVQALASSGANMAWQNYTLTVTNIVPEPGTALLWGAAMVGLALSGWVRRK